MGYNLAYLATPTFGGWVTMTAHLSLKYNYPLFLYDYLYIQNEYLFLLDFVLKQVKFLYTFRNNYYNIEPYSYYIFYIILIMNF